MRDFLLKFFTWWNGQTFGTQFFTWRFGKRVGEDAQGNVFYQNADGSRRWVIYDGEAEASRISPEWHGWLHHTYQEPPTEAPLPRQAWEKPYVPNMTGTALAYHPPGSLLAPERAVAVRLRRLGAGVGHGEQRRGGGDRRGRARDRGRLRRLRRPDPRRRDRRRRAIR